MLNVYTLRANAEHFGDTHKGKRMAEVVTMEDRKEIGRKRY